MPAVKTPASNNVRAPPVTVKVVRMCAICATPVGALFLRRGARLALEREHCCLGNSARGVKGGGSYVDVAGLVID